MQIDTSNQTVLFVAPVCDVCKKQDEHLRAVSLPFVFSVVFFTFTRYFTGVYCRKHRRLYLALASLITATAGWLGIPFGLIQTPLTLFRLANGGISDPHVNALMQRELANKLLMKGDQIGAVRCLEASLRLEDDPQTRQRLTDLYRTTPPRAQAGMLRQIWRVIGVFLVSILVGTLAGVFEAGLGYLLYPLFEKSGSIFAIILSWVPMVLAIFFGILWVGSAVNSALRNTQASSRTFAVGLSAAAALLAFFSLAQIRAMGMNIGAMITISYFSMVDGIFLVRSLLTTGGLFNLFNSFRLYDTAGIIYLILFAAGFGLCLYSTTRSAIQTIQGQTRLTGLRNSGVVEEGESRSLWAWLTLGGLSAAILLFALLVYPGKLVNVEEAFIRIQQGFDAIDTNNEGLALKELERANLLWPDSVLTHFALSSVHGSQFDFDRAYSEAQAALEIDPDSAIARILLGTVQSKRGEYKDAIRTLQAVEAAHPDLPDTHAMLVLDYYKTGEDSLLEQELEHALAVSEQDGFTNTMLGHYYSYLNDLESAEKHYLIAIKLDNDAIDYGNLSHLYALQKKMDKAASVLSEAEELGVDPSEIALWKSFQHWQNKDLDGALSIVLKALESDPRNPDLLSEISFIYNHSGETAKAAEAAKKAIEINPYDWSSRVELAFALHLQGLGTEAREAALKAVALNPKSDRVHYVLGLIYLDAGMKVEARQELETFLDLYYEREYINLERQNALDLLEGLR